MVRLVGYDLNPARKRQWVVRQVNRSLIHRYSFPPQEHTIRPEHDVRDPKTGKSPGTIVEIDEHNRTIDLQRGAANKAPHPTALIPFDIVRSTVLRDSLLRMAVWVADHGMTGRNDFRAARDLLLRERPRVLQGNIETLIGGDGRLTAPAKALLRRLSQQASVLPIQGPPGSGKTFTGARMIVELVDQGRRSRHYRRKPQSHQQPAS